MRHNILIQRNKEEKMRKTQVLLVVLASLLVITTIVGVWLLAKSDYGAVEPGTEIYRYDESPELTGKATYNFGAYTSDVTLETVLTALEAQGYTITDDVSGADGSVVRGALKRNEDTIEFAYINIYESPERAREAHLKVLENLMIFAGGYIQINNMVLHVSPATIQRVLELFNLPPSREYGTVNEYVFYPGVYELQPDFFYRLNQSGFAVYDTEFGCVFISPHANFGGNIYNLNDKPLAKEAILLLNEPDLCGLVWVDCVFEGNPCLLCVPFEEIHHVLGIVSVD